MAYEDQEGLFSECDRRERVAVSGCLHRYLRLAKRKFFAILQPQSREFRFKMKKYI